ncbi:MAG TPA: copper amine oxidase N-terminal domain-containing protein, partial [Candidatus Tumulicola sp.]|nr:copper amine oxidase N-terminal domain-containing protein [Candidatus Tumulicola sp.]
MKPYRPPGWRTLLLVGTVALAASAVLVLSRPVDLIVDGDRVESDVPPVTTVSDRVFVPLRTVADALGAQTTLAGRDRIAVVRGHQSLRVKVGDSRATIDGAPVQLRHAPFRVRGRVMVELHAVASAFDVRASYDPRLARVEVLTPG